MTAAAAQSGAFPNRYHGEDTAYIDARLSDLPAALARALAAQYARTYESGSRIAANDALEQNVRALQHGAPLLAADEHSIDNRARRAADRAGRRAASGDDQREAWEKAAAVCRRHGIEPEHPDEKGGRTLAGAIARMKCPRWWRRRLRTEHGRAVEGVCIRADMVGPGRNRGRYVGPYAAHRWKQQQARLHRMIEEARAVCDTGEEMSLEPIIAASLANPEIRRAELMTRVRGFQEVADQRGDVGEFLTATAPSRFHPTSKGKPNPKYDGSTPREAQHYFRALWSRTRAAWHRAGIRPYGLRVAEPHADGCPHWHMIVFVRPDQRAEACRIFRQEAMRETPDEPGAERYRYKRETIDTTKGSACAYVAKYIAKAIDGYSVGEAKDLFGGLTGDAAEEAAKRIRAWASTWGIRQFQQIGGPPVGVWRELRRMKAGPRQDCALERAREAADAGDWAAYVAANGGIECPADARPIQTWRRKSPLIDERDGYGDPAPAKLRGLRADGVLYPTRLNRWEIDWTGTGGAKQHQPGELTGQFIGDREAAVAGSIGAPSGDPDTVTRRGRVIARREAAGVWTLTPWTRGNNCTQQPPPEGQADARPPDRSGDRGGGNRESAGRSLQ